MMVVGRHLEYFSLYIINYIHKISTVYINYLARNKLTFFQFLPWSLFVIVFFLLKCMYNVKFIVSFIFRPKNKSNKFFVSKYRYLDSLYHSARFDTNIDNMYWKKITETNHSYWLWRPSWKILQKILSPYSFVWQTSKIRFWHIWTTQETFTLLPNGNGDSHFPDLPV